MAVDKGGLEYTIKVQDQFTGELDKFEDGLKTAEKQVKTFGDSLRGLGTAAGEVAKAAKALSSLGNPGQTKKIEKAGNNIRTLAANFRELQDKTRGLDAVQTKVAALAAATRGIGTGRGLNSLIVNMEKFSRTVSQLNLTPAIVNMNALTAAIQRMGAATQTAGPGLLALIQHMRQLGVAAVAANNNLGNVAGALGGQARQARAAQGIFQRLTSSIGRLFLAFVAFRAFASGTQLFGTLVKQGIAFNQVIEESQLALAAIFANAGQVTDAFGRAATGAQAFAIAQTVAAEQVAKLRVDAIKTTATFEELLNAFRQAIAPGLTAGLNVDEIRQVSVLLSQAASAIGVSGGQLAEEIRSIISGTGELRTTRLLQLLPKDFNEQVRRATEAGRLFQFLSDEFGSFSVLGAKLSDTLTAKMDRLFDAIQQVVGEGALPLFNSLKGLLDEIFSQLVVVDEAAGKITPKPEAVEAFRGIADGLVAVVTEVQRIIEDLKAEDVQGIGILFQRSFELAANSLGPLISALIHVTNTVAEIANPILTVVIPVFRAFAAIVEFIAAGTNKAIVQLKTGLIDEVLGLAATAVRTLAVGLALLASIIRDIGVKITLMTQGFTGLGSLIRGVANDLDAWARSLLNIAKIVEGLNKSAPLRGRIGATPGGQVTGRPRDPADLRKIQQETELIEAQTAALQGQRIVRASTLAIQEKLIRGQARQADLEIAQVNEKIQALRTEDAVLGEQTAKAVLKLQLKKEEAATALEQAAIEEQIQATQAKGTAQRKLLGQQLQEQLQTLRRINIEIEKEVEATQRRASALSDEVIAQTFANQAAAQVEAARAFAPGEGARGRAEIELAVAAERVQQEKNVLFLLAQQNAEKERGLREQLEQVVGTEQEAAVRREIYNLQQLSTAQAQGQAIRIETAERELQRLRDQAERPFALGLQTALDNLDVSAFEATVDFLEGAIQGLSATISQAILDGFLDPQADIRESFGNLFKQLAQQLLQLIVQALLVKAISGIGGAVGFSEGGGVGLARGGKVPQRGKASAQHYGKNAKSFAIGGRPKGVPASDTVPAWLTPGEWVMRLSSVMKYGPRVMAAINEGRVDPAALQSAIKTGPVRSSKGPGYATGGRVASSRSAPTPAILVVGEQEAGRILDAGKRQLIAIMRDSAPEVNAALGRRG